MPALTGLSGNNLRAEIRRLLNEPTANVFSDDMINDWINIAARNVSAVTLCNLTQVTTGTLVTNTMRVDLSSSDLIKARAATFYDTGAETKGLQRITPRMYGNIYDDANAVGDPVHWFFFGDYIYFDPGVSTSNIDKINVYGSTMVANYASDFSDATTNTLPDHLQAVCIPFVLSCAYCKDGKHRKAAIEMQRYMAMVMRYRMDVTEEIERVDTRDMRRLPDTTVVPT